MLAQDAVVTLHCGSCGTALVLEKTTDMTYGVETWKCPKCFIRAHERVCNVIVEPEVDDGLIVCPGCKMARISAEEVKCEECIEFDIAMAKEPDETGFETLEKEKYVN